MGKVALNLKVRPENTDVDLEKIKEQVKEKLDNVQEIRETDLAFGMKQLEVLLIFDDEPGGTDKYENAIQEIDGVQTVESGEITLL